jgi:hypothetical protein
MLRIGIAASKMSKGGLLSYNLYVILITGLVSLFVYLICGFSVILIVFLISLIVHVIRPEGLHPHWVHVFKVCLTVLAWVVGVLGIAAILKNIQITRNKI